MPVKVKGRESVNIEEGKHKGQITRVVLDRRGKKGEEFEYIDIFVQPADAKTELKYSCPADLTVNTKLGKTLMNFGVTVEQIESGEEIDVEKLLVGKKVQFLTQNEETPRGTFARIVDGSLKPL